VSDRIRVETADRVGVGVGVFIERREPAFVGR
jgi:hypothetical protein